MTFVELLARLGGMGRFQVTYVAALALPLLMLASHNLLQNFTAGVPEHHCRPRPAANGSAGDIPLHVSIPLDDHHHPQRCRRYVEPQWHLLEVNGTPLVSQCPRCPPGWVCPSMACPMSPSHSSQYSQCPHPPSQWTQN
uniref:Uncharacterized protein n=1 Tax=Falco tinnunculus TaxID=100819 RepID=A0A8C4UYM7_FALTI